LVDGTVLGTLYDGTMTAVVEGIVTTETVDGTHDPAMITGELGHSLTAGRLTLGETTDGAMETQVETC
jgi:hypothetical protein